MKYKKKTFGTPSCRSSAIRGAIQTYKEGVNRKQVLKAVRPYRRVTVRKGC